MILPAFKYQSIIYKLIPLIFLVSLSFMLTQCKHSPESYFSPIVHKKWETTASFQTPESVKYDSINKLFFVSNIQGDPFKKDGKGYISKLSLDGKIIGPDWLIGLDAPKGMGIFQGYLYVTNITEIVKIDILTAKISTRYPVNGAKFLNDIDIDEQGVIYFSDMIAGKIYRMIDGVINLWLEGSEFEACNGLIYYQGSLYIGTRDNIIEVQSDTLIKSVFASKTGPIDGLEIAGSDEIIFSNWNGLVYKVKRNGTKELLLNTSTASINAADIEFLPGAGLLLVPTFNDNRVMAYEIK